MEKKWSHAKNKAFEVNDRIPSLSVNLFCTLKLLVMKNLGLAQH